MALLPCRECGEQVSTEAATCPRCGIPSPAGGAPPQRFQLDVWQKLFIAGIILYIVGRILTNAANALQGFLLGV